ncbi:N-acetylmuramoyl-L-alanine amidase [Clostridium sp.]|uniref:N-acetylmuramoyl-L-alanine amidase n=1 Tax=Clostridium sp. TaxID=1506 RepID=UPI002909CCE9|nr:N-acetylmuramoyl-L-alanine amidase [Clostridium sp.]MDU3524246.1 N-acetylmuramoyl-L-alanine amidase [Clostridium sp.]MDU3546275.1 N-acetylmuramoyl-L-alanine amidase [Clostridium sp.]MDU6363284.1 N-acetylmuramoyl-L-alanine amidase [Clostridium sp.]
MKIGIDMGHCLTGFDTSANGVIKESDANRVIGKLVISKLRAVGHTVIDCTINSGCMSLNDSLSKRVNKANSQQLDVFCSIHLNAGGGNGTETYVAPRKYFSKDESYNKNIDIAKKVNDLVADSCKFNNRGVKIEEFYVITATNASAILVEVCFCDSQEDVGKLNYEKVANAIVEGLTVQIVNNQPKKENVINKASTSEYEIKRYSESGKCTICVSEGVYFYNKPFISEVTGSYEYSESVYYDQVVISNKYVYISWISDSTGVRRYMPVFDKVKNERWGICV